MKISHFDTAKEVFIIAELSANHAGSLELALETIKAAKKAGAHAVKFQTYTANSLTLDSDKDDFIIKGGLWDGRRFYELYDELRAKQGTMSVQMCAEFLRLYPHITARAQSGAESFYPKRSPKDSELDINKSLNEQFNLLRICSNDEFPAFFIKNGKKFVLKIYDES